MRFDADGSHFVIWSGRTLLPQERSIRSMLRFSSAGLGDSHCNWGRGEVTCQGKRCVCGGALEQSRSSEVEQSIEISFFGTSRMERDLLHETTLALKATNVSH